MFMSSKETHTFTITETSKMEYVCEDGLLMELDDSEIVEDMIWMLNEERGNRAVQTPTAQEMAQIWLMVHNVACDNY